MQPLLKSLRTLLCVSILGVGALARCDCEETQEFVPAARYTPEAVLDFGNVSVSGERKLAISVVSNGGAALRLKDPPTKDNDPRSKFTILISDDLRESGPGLAPGRTSSISVTYRPCPEAWQGAALRTGFDLGTCDVSPDSAVLNVLEIGSRFADTEGARKFTLAGQPVQPPVVEVLCQNGSPACSAASPNLIPCVGMVYGPVSADGQPCDMLVEVRNKKRDGAPTGDLLIERIEIKVQNFNLPDGQRVTKRGEEVGFEVLGTDDQPLSPDAASPLAVPIPDLMNFGAFRFKIRFSGTVSGFWYGADMQDGTGVKISTSDPDKPLVKFNINGSGSAPTIQVDPSAILFGPVAQSTTKTGTLTVTNAGDAPLQITNIRFESDQTGAKFRVSTSRGSSFPITVQPGGGDRLFLFIAYTPTAAGLDSDRLLIGSNDRQNNSVAVPISGGAVPRIMVDPDANLVFPIDAPPPRKQTITVQNVGFGELEIQRLSITGPGGDPTHPSVDDFFLDIPGCPARTQICTIGTILYPPTGSGSSEITYDVVYENNDISQTDLAELHIASTDPVDANRTLVLSSSDDPCLFPTPVITLVTTNPTVNLPITVDANSSNPGGAGGTARITSYHWFWIFTPGIAPVFSANDSGAAAITTFTSSRDGVHVLGLDVTNDCGAQNQRQGNANIPIGQ